MKRRKALITLVFITTALVSAGMPTTLRAAQHGEPNGAEEMARQAIEQLMRALELMIESIPQYEMPEINEDGDIIIRRKHRMPHPEPGERERNAPEIEETTI